MLPDALHKVNFAYFHTFSRKPPQFSKYPQQSVLSLHTMQHAEIAFGHLGNNSSAGKLEAKLNKGFEHLIPGVEPGTLSFTEHEKN